MSLQSMPRLILLVAFWVGLIFSLDVATGPEIAISIFYLIPIAVATWYGSRNLGVGVSIVCALAWRFGDSTAGATYSNPVIPYWNAVVRFGFFLIVTETLAARRRIEAELLAARAGALDASRAKTDFVNRVTHELRTPLTSIIGFADLLQKRAAPFLTDQDRECLRRIRVNSESLLSMVDGVLDIGRVEARRRPAGCEPVDVTALVESVAADLRGRPLPAELSLTVRAPARVTRVITDPALLRQVLLNLGTNAVKFTDSGVVRLEVLSDGESALGVAVHDTGIGIAPEQLETIFEPFEQADGAIHRRFGGAGLGLTISRDLCEVMGHRLEVESQVGVGSTFRVIFASPKDIISI